MGAERTIAALFALVSVAVAIECYTGWTYVKGQPFSLGSEKCSLKRYCYNLTLDSQTVTDGVKKAGCSNFRCATVGTGCHRREMLGHKVTFCCCNDRDKCNSKYSLLTTKDKIKEGAKDVKNLLDNIWNKLEGPFG